MNQLQATESQAMIRKISRPAAAHCTLAMYAGFLLSEPKAVSCSRLAEVMNISHDSVNRFLYRESYTGQDLFNEAKGLLNVKGGTLSVDDSVLDKPYSQYMAFVGHSWSGKHHRTVKGINLITLYYTDPQGQHQPINFRIYTSARVKPKTIIFRTCWPRYWNGGFNPLLSLATAGMPA